MIKFELRFQIIALFLLAPVLFVSIGNSIVSAAVLKEIIIAEKPGSVSVVLSEKVPFKVVRVDGNEVLIALKNVDTTRIALKRGKPGSLIRNVAVEDLSGGVMAIVVTGTEKFEQVRSLWDKTGTTLVVSLAPKKVLKKSPLPTAKQPAKKQPTKPAAKQPATKQLKTDKQSVPVPGKKAIIPGPSLKTTGIVTEAKGGDAGVKGKEEFHAPTKRAASIFQGNIHDILIKAKVSECADKDMVSALGNLKKGLWEAGGTLLDSVILKGGACLEKAYYLRAYAGLMEGSPGDHQKNLATIRLFQNALALYPDSDLFPFALAGLGILHTRLKNPAAAEGFFSIIRDGYRDYPGLAEVLYSLGMIYDAKGYNEQALAYFKEVFEKLPENAYTVDAGIGVGKALFKKKFYIDSLNILSRLLKSNPEKIYDSSELLLSIGKANFELGRTIAARESLNRVLNLFPDIEGKDMIMTNIAETYAVDNSNARAESLYRFVIKTYPGGEGFINSSMGLALVVKDMEEKKTIYAMVKEKFPEHALASVAMMRLAEIYDKEGEYAKCIGEIETLLATHPHGLRYEALKLMQQAYEALFDKKFKGGSYPDVLHTFEKQHVLLDSMESGKIHLTVGLSYLEARLYDQAFNQLIKAYKLYEQNKWPESLIFGLGTAMDETDRKNDALDILSGFVKRFPSSDKFSEASFRMGDILVDKNEFTKAVASFDLAYGASHDPIEKGNILVHKGKVYKAQNDWPRVSDILIMAAKEFSLAPGTNYQLISNIHTQIGESYLEQKLYLKAADAFVMALKLGDRKEPRADIGFMLGDAYQKANILKKARAEFEKIASMDDSIWSKLAKERLVTLDLAQKAENS